MQAPSSHLAASLTCLAAPEALTRPDIRLGKPGTRLSVRSNFFWALAGNIAASGGQWLAVVLLARLGSAEMVGQYGLGLAITSPIFLLAGLNLRTLQVTDVKGNLKFAEYLRVRLVTTVAALAVVAGIAIFGGMRFDTAMVVLLIGAAKAFEAVSEAFHGSWHQRERLDLVAASQLLRGIAYAAALSGFLWWRGTALWGAAGVAAASATVLAAHDLWRDPAPHEPKPGFWKGIFTGGVWANLKAVAPMAGPLGLVAVLVSLAGSLPRFWLAHLATEADVGRFSAMSYLVIAANTAVMALGQASGPEMARSFAMGDVSTFARRATRLGMLGAVLGAGAIAVSTFAGRAILGFSYGPEYAAQTAAFQWLMVGGALGFIASCTGYTLSAARCFVPQVPLLVVTCAVVSAGCWLLIPNHGISGAAIAMMLGYAVQAIISTAMVFYLCRPISPTFPSHPRTSLR